MRRGGRQPRPITRLLSPRRERDLRLATLDSQKRQGSDPSAYRVPTIQDMESRRSIEDLSEDELREYACEHVLYEITHFVRATQAIEAAAVGLFPMNFAIEVFALHLRNLLDFFAPRNARRTDACAENFFEEWEEPNLDLYLREARWMADKHIAHLTIDRTADIELKTWAVEPIVRSLVPIIERFADEADLVCETFRACVAERLAELPAPRDPTERPPGLDLAPGS